MWKTISQDLQAVFERDPAATSRLEVVLTYAGFHALLAYRLAHWLKEHQVPFLPRAISQLARWLTGIEIHPSAKIGCGFRPNQIDQRVRKARRGRLRGRHGMKIQRLCESQ